MAKWIKTDYGQLVNLEKFASIEICFIANWRYFSYQNPSEIDNFVIVGNYQRNTSTRKSIHKYTDKSLKASYPVCTEDSINVILLGGVFDAGHLQELEDKLLAEIDILHNYLTGKTTDYDNWLSRVEGEEIDDNNGYE